MDARSPSAEPPRWRAADAAPPRGTGARLAVTIAEAAPAQLAELVAIERSCFTDPWSERALGDAVDNPQILTLVATEPERGAVVGYVVAWFVLDEGDIANVAVAEEWRGRGVGAALLDAALARARARGVGALHLEVRASNAVARALYASRGFVEVGRRRGYYRRPPEDAIVLRLDERQGIE